MCIHMDPVEFCIMFFDTSALKCLRCKDPLPYNLDSESCLDSFNGDLEYCI